MISRCKARTESGPGVTERGRLRHAPFRLRDRCVFTRWAAGELQLRLAARRDANLLADAVVGLQPQRHRSARVLRHDLQRKNDIAGITDGIAAGSIGKTPGHRPEHGDRFHIFRTGEIEVGGKPESPA